MMPARMPILACLLSALVAAPLARAEALGRLFFTPEERQALERQKLANHGGQRLSLDGRLSRGSGKATCWINGSRAEAASEAPCPKETDLKVGESIVPATGTRQDLLQGGQIVIHRRRGP